jgi:uncharacterized membrane protein YcfT
MSTPATKTARLDWVDTAKGISILLVVMMYSAYSVGEDTGATGFMHYVIGFATPFRMPEFFLISGLFLSQVISRPWLRYADRRIVHYFYFYALWAVIHIAVKAGLGQGDPLLAAGQLGLAIVEPYGVLWFIYMLGVFSLAARLLWQIKAPHWLVLGAAALLQMAAIASPSYAVTQFAAYFVFFYAGYVGAPLVFKLIEWVHAHPGRAGAGLALWALVNGALVFSPGFAVLPSHTQMGFAALPGLHLVLAIAGGLAICTGASLLLRLSWMNWLRWVGEHSIVVYLAFALPMSALRILALKTGVLTEPGLLSLFLLIAATALPIALYAATRVTGFGKFLFERPAWAHLPGALPSRAPAPSPSATPAE